MLWLKLWLSPIFLLRERATLVRVEFADTAPSPAVARRWLTRLTSRDSSALENAWASHASTVAGTASRSRRAERTGRHVPRRRRAGRAAQGRRGDMGPPMVGVWCRQGKSGRV